VKIAFVGLPLAALLLARDGHAIVWAGVCRKGALGTRRLRRAAPTEIVPSLDEPRVQARIRAAAPDLLVSWFWTKKVPRTVLAIPPLGGVGVHPSLLPRHRGPDPYFWAIDAGDTVTGVTAHRLDEAYDTGAVYDRREVALDPTWNAWTLAKKLDRPSLALLRDVVGRLPLPAAAQDETLATAAPAPSDDDLVLAWTRSAAAVVRRVRAAAPWPGATTWLGEREVVVTRAETTADVPRALEPGEAAVLRCRDGHRAVVRAADLGVALLAGRDVETDAELDTEALANIVAGLSGMP